MASDPLNVLGLRVLLSPEDASQVPRQLAERIRLLIITIVVGQKATLQTHWLGRGQWVRAIRLRIVVSRTILVAKVDQIVDLDFFVGLVVRQVHDLVLQSAK